MNITAIGLDLAKNVIQVHAVDQEGRMIVRKQLSRPITTALPCRHGSLRQFPSLSA